MEDSLPADDSIDSGSFTDDYDEPYASSEARVRRYLELMSAIDELKDLRSQTYVPVIHRGVKGIFVPETSVSRYQAAAGWRRSSPTAFFTPDEVESAADRWSLLVLQQVKKALDEYDRVNRLADELKRRRRRRI